MNRRHIAYVLPVADPNRGGAEAWLGGLLPGVMSAGHQITVICREAGELPAGVDLVTLPSRGTEVAQIRGFWDACDFHLKANSYDIVHALDLCPRATILNPHGGAEQIWLQQYLNSKQGLDKCWATWQRRWGARQRLVFELEKRQLTAPTLKRILAISSFVKESLQQNYALPDELFRLVPNGVDTARFTAAISDGERLRLRSAFGISPGERLMLFVGHNFHLKGLRNAIDMLARCRRENTETRLVVIGRGKAGPFRRQARALGVASALRFVGATDELVQWYRAADLLLAPTWYDACSLATLEALASGLPVVTSRFNGAKLYLEQGVTGCILENPGDIAAGARAVVELTTPEATRRVRERGPQVAAFYSQQANLRGILDCYQEIWSESEKSS